MQPGLVTLIGRLKERELAGYETILAEVDESAGEVTVRATTEEEE